MSRDRESSQDLGNRFLAALNTGRAEKGGGIPLDLLPYLEESDSELDSSPNEQAQEEQTADPQLEQYFKDFWGWEEEGQQVSNEEESDTSATELSSEEISRRYREICEQIFSRRPEHDISPTKERIELLLDFLANPQKNYLSLHVAGTNGKTSTARIADSLITELGLRVGRYTSPHLEEVGERIAVMGTALTKAEVIAAYADIEQIVAYVDTLLVDRGLGKLSFFEIMTAMAFQVFSDAPVEVAVIETGMGGSWDATNVIDSPIQIITPISYDHQDYLGYSLGEIAAEKAGIIKTGADVVIAVQPEEAAEVIRQRLTEVNAHGYWLGEDFEIIKQGIAVGGQVFTLRTPAAVYEDLFIPLHGMHQITNAACAIMAVELMRGGKSLSSEVLEAALNKVTSPGRLEFIRHSPAVIVDSAHNPAGARVLADTLTNNFDFGRIIGVFSAFADKNIEAILGEVEPTIDELVITQIPEERGIALEDLAEIAISVFGEDRVSSQPYVGDALVEAIDRAEANADPNDSVAVVIFGSIRLAGQAKALSA